MTIFLYLLLVTILPQVALFDSDEEEIYSFTVLFGITDKAEFGEFELLDESAQKAIKWIAVAVWLS